MITWITMLVQKVNSASAVLIVVIVSWLLFAGLFLAMKPNRQKSKFKNFLIDGVAITVASDILWLSVFFDNFRYNNPGLGGFLWLGVLPLLLIISVLIMSYANASLYEFDKKKREKAEAKARKKEKARKKYEKRLAKQQKEEESRNNE